eukprot:TRINITY_DN3529_c0_g1_i1.p1 TRINITY_DN3529_c0_g1~~TRINITY_DN3529_c0_g1_i1.p1  ORF type:complete len:133 (-),score=13.51 TRINITY_DN3529_c0_g1_i1:80-478(-)
MKSILLVLVLIFAIISTTYSQSNNEVPDECNTCIAAKGQTVPCGQKFSDEDSNSTTIACAKSCLVDGYTCCGCNIIGGRKVCGGCPSTSVCKYNPSFPNGDSPLYYWCVSSSSITTPVFFTLVVSILFVCIF